MYTGEKNVKLYIFCVFSLFVSEKHGGGKKIFKQKKRNLTFIFIDKDPLKRPERGSLEF